MCFRSQAETMEKFQALEDEVQAVRDQLKVRSQRTVCPMCSLYECGQKGASL